MRAPGAASAHPGPPAAAEGVGGRERRLGVDRPDGHAPLMSIGEVLTELRPEFPDTTISKLRFLEAEGLVRPQRTAAGYRKYSWDDVARLRYVLIAQRDQYLPLRVIRTQLEELEQVGGEGLARHRPPLMAVGPGGQSQAEDGDVSPEPAGSWVSRTELAGRAGLTTQALGELERQGLIHARTPGWYDADALSIAQAAAELARYGIEARHLRGYRSAADREVGLFAQVLAPLMRQNDPAARARAAETARELAALSQRMHAALVRTALRETLER